MRKTPAARAASTVLAVLLALAVIVVMVAVGPGAEDAGAVVDQVEAVGPAEVAAVAVAVVLGVVAVLSTASDICRYIIAAGHPLDSKRSAFFYSSGHVYCSWYHRAVNPSNGSVYPTGYCHQGDYFTETGVYYPGPIFGVLMSVTSEARVIDAGGGEVRLRWDGDQYPCTGATVVVTFTAPDRSVQAVIADLLRSGPAEDDPWPEACEKLAAHVLIALYDAGWKVTRP